MATISAISGVTAHLDEGEAGPIMAVVDRKYLETLQIHNFLLRLVLAIHLTILQNVLHAFVNVLTLGE